MVTVAIVLRAEKKKDGKFPLAIRITKDRKSSFIYLDYRLKKEDWDADKQRVKKTHPNSVRLNNFLLKKLAETNEHALEIEGNRNVVTSHAVRQKIKPTASATFFGQSDLYLQRLKEAGKYNEYTANKPRIKHFKEFIRNDIAFPDISISLLERFKSYVITQLKLSERSAVNHLSVIRSVFSFAVKEGVVDKKHSPFGKGKVKIKFPESSKIGLNEEEIERLESIELNPRENHVRNLWLFSYYFAGMRVSDVLRLRWSDFQNDRLYYGMGKNQKADSLKVPDKALAILKQYEAFKENKVDLVFPELKGVDLSDQFITKRTIAFKTSAIDKCLNINVAPKAEITKKLTMHISRHSFAQMAGDTISIQLLQKLYRHESILTTMGYQSNFTHEQTDDALDKVLGKKPKEKSNEPK